jgi:class 3 adenylate cyclase
MIPVCLSVVAMAIAWFAGLGMETYEAVSVDFRMNLRCRTGGDSARQKRARQDIVLLAVDPESQDRLGRYGQGRWLSREPFFEQLAFFAGWYKPTVMGFDVLFQDEDGWKAGETLMESDSGATDEDVRLALERRSRELRPLSLPVLHRINRMIAKQGDEYLAHCLASVRDAFPVIAGYSARGGWLNEQAAQVPPWSDTDVFGTNSFGDESYGERVPFLKDMAIPEADVRLPPGGFRDDEYMWNANLPARKLLNYIGLGFLDGPPDSDSVIRRLSLVAGVAYSNRVTGVSGRFFVPSLALAVVMTHIGIPFPVPDGAVKLEFGREIRLRSPKGVEYRVPIDRCGRLQLNYDVLFHDFKHHSLARFVGIPDGDAGKRIADMYRSHFDGSIVFVGVTLTGVDWGACPVDQKIPRVFVHMVAANNILNHDFLAPVPLSGRLAVLFALAALCTMIALAIRGIRVSLAFLGVGLAYAAAVWVCAQTGIVLLPVVAPLLYLVLMALFVLVWRYFSEEKERKRTREMFATMVSQPVLRFLEEHPESFSLRGHSADATVFFSDLTGFTKMSESMPPDRLVAILNGYFSPVTNAIMDAEGYVDKYTGDGIMAVWGAPYPNPSHAEKACAAALRQRELMHAVNEQFAVPAGIELRVRTGINSGHVVAGNMGSGRKFQYTVIGDAVNLAARLEPFNKDFGTDIIME